MSFEEIIEGQPVMTGGLHRHLQEISREPFQESLETGQVIREPDGTVLQLFSFIMKAIKLISTYA